MYLRCLSACLLATSALPTQDKKPAAAPVAPTTVTAPPIPIYKTILITAGVENVTSKTGTAAATRIGGVAVGSGPANSSTYEHSEVWEVMRRFQEECPAVNFVTNPETPHTMTIHADYEKVGSLLSVVLYQLVLLDNNSNPLYISKKNYLRREIKPICKVIKSR